MSKPFMILAHHRSGSNYLTDILQRHPAVDVIDEPLSMHTDYFPAMDLVRWPEDLAGHVRESQGHAFVEGLLAYMRSSDDVRGFKETLLFEKLPWLYTFAPDLKIVHLVRNPLAVVSSALHHPARSRWNYESLIPKYLEAYDDHGIDRNEFDLGANVDLCVASWLIRQREAQRCLGVFDSIQVLFEDLLLTPMQELGRVMDFLGLERHRNQADFIQVAGEAHRGQAYSTFRDKATVLNAWKNMKRDYRDRSSYLLHHHGVVVKSE